MGETSVGKYVARHRKPPGQVWRTFLENHVKSLVSVDFFTAPTIRALIVDVIVPPEYQGRGIGTSIMARLIERCRAARIRDVQLFLV